MTARSFGEITLYFRHARVFEFPAEGYVVSVDGDHPLTEYWGFWRIINGHAWGDPLDNPKDTHLWSAVLVGPQREDRPQGYYWLPWHPMIEISDEVLDDWYPVSVEDSYEALELGLKIAEGMFEIKTVDDADLPDGYFALPVKLVTMGDFVEGLSSLAGGETEAAIRKGIDVMASLQRKLALGAPLTEEEQKANEALSRYPRRNCHPAPAGPPQAPGPNGPGPLVKSVKVTKPFEPVSEYLPGGEVGDIDEAQNAIVEAAREALAGNLREIPAVVDLSPVSPVEEQLRQPPDFTTIVPPNPNAPPPPPPARATVYLNDVADGYLCGSERVFPSSNTDTRRFFDPTHTKTISPLEVKVGDEFLVEEDKGSFVERGLYLCLKIGSEAGLIHARFK